VGKSATNESLAALETQPIFKMAGAPRPSSNAPSKQLRSAVRLEDRPHVHRRPRRHRRWVRRLQLATVPGLKEPIPMSGERLVNVLRGK